jgi:dCTP deaminase
MEKIVVVNGEDLLMQAPLKGMLPSKERRFGVSHGLGEAGYDIRIKQDVLLHPFRRFRLASSMEYFDMPDDLVAVVHDKSSWARQGVSVFNSVIEPGWEGWLTIELAYHRWKPLFIPAGAGIAQIIFHKLSETAAYTGRYQHQPDRPVPAIAAE